MEKQKNDEINNLPNSNVNEYNVQNNIQEHTNSKNMKKKTNISAIFSFIFAVHAIYMAKGEISLFLEGHAGRANYMWQLSLIFGILILAIPLAVLSVVTGTIGLNKSYKLENGSFSKWISIFGITVGIVCVIIDIVVLALQCATG